MQAGLQERHHRLLHHLSRLPRLMTHIHGRDNASEFILFELCSAPCFNLRRAAYLVDNPDFNCVRGITGYDAKHPFVKSDSIWEYPDDFSQHMQQSSFNRQVRSIILDDVKEDGKQGHINEIAKTLGFGSSDYCSWAMRHDNHGILMYEKNDCNDLLADDHIVDGMSLLSFCPIF